MGMVLKHCVLEVMRVFTVPIFGREIYAQDPALALAKNMEIFQARKSMRAFIPSRPRRGSRRSVEITEALPPFDWPKPRRS